MEFERIYSEIPKTSIWSRLDILTTFNGVKSALKKKVDLANLDISEELIDQKSRGVAFCVRSAKDLFHQSNSANLTPTLICLYYGTYNLLSALLIGSLTNDLTLNKIENASKWGHGLKAIYDEESSDNISMSEYVYATTNGFYPKLLKEWGYDVSSIGISQRYNGVSEIPDNEKKKLCSLKDLLSRIPELKSLYVEIFEEQPQYLDYHANWQTDQDYISLLKISPKRNTHFLTSNQINDILGLSSEFIFEFRLENESSREEEFICNQDIPTSIVPRKPKYRSTLASSCTVKPLLGIEDVMLFYFQLLYLVHTE